MGKRYNYAKPSRQYMQRLMIDSVAQQWERIEYMAQHIPEDSDNELSETACELIIAIQAITEEWILDPRTRDKLSPIEFE